jgi:hypothetical protein
MVQDLPPVRRDESAEGPPFFSSWNRLYLAILVWELIVILLIAALSRWQY